jgi:soluble lytic murein transglycosylase-like protein
MPRPRARRRPARRRWPLYAAVVAALAIGTAAADIYTYTDDEGVVHFTNLKPKGKKWSKLIDATPDRGSKAAADRGDCARCDAVPARDHSPERFHRYDEHIYEAAALYRLPVPLVRAIIKVESDYDPNVVSSVGAKGLMQLMPAVEGDMRVASVFEPRDNIMGGTRLLRILANKFDGDLVLTIAAYHAGGGAVEKYGNQVPPYPHTRQYVRMVLDRYYEYKARDGHLIELYGLDPIKALFRVLRSLAQLDPEALAQLCLVCAYARDPQLRHSFALVRTLRLGEVLERATMERHLEAGFPGRFSAAMKKSLAQNVGTTWTFGGHLVGRAKKVRRLPEPRPVSAAYAMFVGYLTGLRGERLLDSAYGALVASSRTQLQSALALASARGLLTLKQAAGVVEFDFASLLTPAEQVLLHESD